MLGVVHTSKPPEIDAQGAAGERTLLDGLRCGDEQAYAEFVRLTHSRMLAVARRFLRRDEDAADAVQDAYISLIRAIPSFQGQSSLSTWLHRIVVNACLMRLRAQRKRPTVPIDELLPQFDQTGHHARSVRSWTEPTTDTMGADELRRQVRECIESLPDDYRAVVMLRDIEELDTEQTAEILNTTPGNVKTRLHRARQALRTLLEHALATPHDETGQR
ncbi:MAG: sigma-70 family RNA polymerase sigma factor [Planctomycetes bacterium]|nr:sigma-70 family RNA polymerase sigma factor [Planctomycetota bacterium]